MELLIYIIISIILWAIGKFTGGEEDEGWDTFDWEEEETKDRSSNPGSVREYQQEQKETVRQQNESHAKAEAARKLFEAKQQEKQQREQKKARKQQQKQTSRFDSINIREAQLNAANVQPSLDVGDADIAFFKDLEEAPYEIKEKRKTKNKNRVSRSDLQDMRRAVIINEVLSPPKAYQE